MPLSIIRRIVCLLLKAPAKARTTGAAGQIGYCRHIYVIIASGAVLGDRDIELRLFELEPALLCSYTVRPRELEDCAFPY